MAKEYLYKVGLKNKETGDRFDLQVWAQNGDEATHKLTGTLIGYHCQYAWCGTGVLYENNKPVTRDIKD